MRIALIDYNAGNIRSVAFALERLGCSAELSREPDRIRSADKVIFPGQGEAATTMAYLRQSGLAELIPTLKQPVLGICVGMQLLCSHSEEGDTECLGVFDEKVRRFDPAKGEKVPHMGWNSLRSVKGGLFPPELEGRQVYFVHSYYVEESPHASALCHYCLPFSAALEKGNFFATQFHPEKSGSVGESILRRFLSL